MWSVCDYCVSLISLKILGFVEYWDFVSNSYGIPLDRATCLQSRLNIKYISSTWVYTMLIVTTSLFLTSWRLPHVILLWHWLLEVMIWKTSNHLISFHFWSPRHFISWLNKDLHLQICDSSRLDWFLGLNIHLPFSNTSGTSMPRLPLALLRCMIHHDQVLVNPTSTIIMSHTSFHVFHRLILENLLLMINLFP
jgi:hypothetical protein